MKKLKAGFSLLLFLFVATCASFAGDLSSMFGQMESIFPEKYDKQLAQMYRLEDRVVFLFREMIIAELLQSSKQEPVLNGYLKKALNRYWLLESLELKKAVLEDPEYYAHRLGKYVRRLPNTYDQAAFSFMFSAVQGNVARLAPFADAANKAIVSLKDPLHQKAYVAEIEKSRDFFRHIPLIFKPLQKLDEKVDALIERLQQKFLLEKMILAVDALCGSKEGSMRSALLKFRGKLSEKLVKKISANLEVQLEAGIEEDAITGIMKSSQGVMIKQVLYQGRIRTFVKEMQKSETLNQINCFATLMNNLKIEFARLRKMNIDEKSKATLDKMSANFDEMQLIMKLKLRKSNLTSPEFDQFVKEFDEEISNSESTEVIHAL